MFAAHAVTSVKQLYGHLTDLFLVKNVKSQWFKSLSFLYSIREFTLCYIFTYDMYRLKYETEGRIRIKNHQIP